MSARPLFDIPEGWRLRMPGERRAEGDLLFGRTEKAFEDGGFVVGTVGQIITELDSMFTLSRIGPQTPAPAAVEYSAPMVDVKPSDSRQVIIWALEAARDFIAKQQVESAALTSRVSALEGALAEIRRTCRLGADMLEIAGLDSKDRIEAHRRLFDASISSSKGAV